MNMRTVRLSKGLDSLLKIAIIMAGFSLQEYWYVYTPKSYCVTGVVNFSMAPASFTFVYWPLLSTA